jgi:uncharacterized protein (DUF488 family)
MFDPKIVYTIGHSTRTADDLIALLREAGVSLLADVRAIPRSRTNPQFNIDALPSSLAAVGIGYWHFSALGGRRSRPRGSPPSPNGFWKNAGFRNYADYAMTEDFRRGLDALLALARNTACAVMCAEAVWWRCHRRIIADYLVAEGMTVRHILAPGQIEDATLTPEARAGPGRTLTYPMPGGDQLSLL